MIIQNEIKRVSPNAYNSSRQMWVLSIQRTISTPSFNADPTEEKNLSSISLKLSRLRHSTWSKLFGHPSIQDFCCGRRIFRNQSSLRRIRTVMHTLILSLYLQTCSLSLNQILFFILECCVIQPKSERCSVISRCLNLNKTPKKFSQLSSQQRDLNWYHCKGKALARDILGNTKIHGIPKLR